MIFLYAKLLARTIPLLSDKVNARSVSQFTLDCLKRAHQ
ncbi:Uncharacterised protein [Vibrio cholerae]|nr:Uncharacterised protein [Vibrio cholerae]